MTTSVHTFEPGLRPLSSNLRSLLAQEEIVRYIEVFIPLVAKLVHPLQRVRDGKLVHYHGFFSSSLTDSHSRCMPDNESLDFSLRMINIDQTRASVPLPVAYDADTGGHPEHFAMRVPLLEQHGVDAVMIEDKIGLKRNTLLGTAVPQQQDDSHAFGEKLAMGKAASRADTMFIARIESLPLGKGVQDALHRARVYLESGADGILISHTESDPTLLWEFCKRYRAEGFQSPLVAVPTAYSHVTEEELVDAGIRLVIYPNQMLRSAVESMLRSAISILDDGNAFDVEERCGPTGNLIGMVEGGN